MGKYEWMNNNMDMINHFIDKLMVFINDYKQDFKLNTDNESFYQNFANFLYDKYYSDEDFDEIIYDNNFDYFDTKYCSDIIDLFTEFKHISYGYTNDIFLNKNEAYDLIEFIYNNIKLDEDYNKGDVDNSSEEENIENEEYY